MSRFCNHCRKAGGGAIMSNAEIRFAMGNEESQKEPLPQNFAPDILSPSPEVAEISSLLP